MVRLAAADAAEASGGADAAKAGVGAARDGGGAARPAAPPADGARCARALRHLLLRDALARYRAGAHHAEEQLAYAVAAAPAELARVRLQCALARWAGAAASASAAARMRGALFETRRHDGLLRAVRRWLAWRRRALVWRQKSLRRVAAAGGPLRLHNDHMRTFDARAASSSSLATR